VSYEPPALYRRTDAERISQTASWVRPDRAFFAAGACHILTFEFLRARRAEGFVAVGLQRLGQPYYDHVYASNGKWAFDFSGWTLEADLFGATLAFERRTTPNICLDRIIVAASLEQLCASTMHGAPDDFADDPRARATVRPAPG
jgi:hypothetical protein